MFCQRGELREYFWTFGDRLSYKEDACLEDFAARVGAVGEMTAEQVVNACKAVEKVYKKYEKECM